jgi:hypothetical protein
MTTTLTFHLASGLLAASLSLPAAAGTWGATRTLQGPFAVSSLPAAPLVAMNGAGSALLAWNATGNVRYAERPAGAAWQASRPVPGASTGAGPVAVAIGNNDAAAIAFTTVATRYVPSKLMLTLRAPGAAAFGAAIEPVPGASAGDIRLGVACDGSVTLLWQDAVGIHATALPGTGATAGACNGQPGSGPWTQPELLSGAGVGAGLADLVVNDAGAALAVWQQGAPGAPTSIGAAVRPAGAAWLAEETVSAPTGLPTWNPKPGIDAAGNVAVGYLDGLHMVVARRPVAGAWAAPVLVSGTQNAYYPALAMSASGDVLAAWLALDASNIGSVWQRQSPAGAAWGTATRLSAAAESADWPSAALSGDGSVAVVGWTDNNSNSARASVRTAGAWQRKNLGSGYWSGSVPVAAGWAAAVAGWTAPTAGNPNSARLVARSWQ